MRPDPARKGVLLKAARQANTLVQTYPTRAVAELNRRNVRIVMIARGERMSSIPEVFRDAGTSMDERYWAGMGGPLTVGTEANLIDNQGGENVFIHEFGHTVDGWGLRYADPRFGPDLDAAYSRARSMGLWNNTHAGSNVGEYWAEGVQDYFDLNREGPPGGDGGQLWHLVNGNLRNPQSGKCLDADAWGTANGTQLIIWFCGTNQSNQTWRFQP
ncbi:ricin-type beta-trefoil lectin domain protein [Dactylosporangium sp. NPDC049742]|uniref:ricin-type beta-trefoil lectin domain protein n=1 Tax=Dactylosporangium sp. NPDC049742 TaxID=3154737 RepID=UPI0034471AB0